MPKPARILCPVDFSEGSREALDYAIFLAENADGHVDVLHVWEAPVVVRPDLVVWLEGSSGPALADLVKIRAEAAMDHFIASLDAKARSRITSRVLHGTTVQTIVEEAAKGSYDLLVMGTHGRSGLPRLVLGSVTERVLRHASCPVLAVHPPEHGSRQP